MSWIIEWNGTPYDVDPHEFSGRELSMVKLRTGLALRPLIQGVLDSDGDAIRVLFWVVAQRTEPELVFSDYDGPPVGLIVKNLPGLAKAMEELGKDLPDMKPETQEQQPTTEI